MAVIGGCLFVVVAVLAGFMMAGGHVHALIHPSEFVTIGGASFGALIVMSPKKVLVDLFRGVLQLIKGSPFNKGMYLELFGLLFALARAVKRDGLLSLEAVISEPHNHPIFQKFPKVNGNHHAVEFICTALSLIVDGKATPEKLTAAFEQEVEVINREHHMAIGALSKTADGLPGFGIVAAVLGIVVTMGAIDGPASEVGHKVGAALVGTFLGILMSYGFFAPMAGRMEILGEMELSFFRAVSAGVVSISTGDSPRDVMNNARRVVGTEMRPSLAEMATIAKEAG